MALSEFLQLADLVTLNHGTYTMNDLVRKLQNNLIVLDIVVRT